MPWKPEVFVDGQWSQNALVFATEDEAAQSAHNLFMRWTLCSDSRAVEVPDAVVNYRLNEHGGLESVDEKPGLPRGCGPYSKEQNNE
jgi:hypothetical protein